MCFFLKISYRQFKFVNLSIGAYFVLHKLLIFTSSI